MRTFVIIITVILSFLPLSCKTQTENRIKRPIPELNYSELEKKNFPNAIFLVNDFEKLLNSEQISDLETIINDYRIKTEREIVIISIDSINPYTNISNYSVDLSNYLGIGKDGNGLTIVVSKKLKKMFIATGNQTEKILTDEHCKKIIDELIIPNFKNDNYYEGLKFGLMELIKVWN